MSDGFSRDDVQAWLERSGWFPGRDVTEKVTEFINDAVRQSDEQGFPTPPTATATEFLRSYGLLELKHPRNDDKTLDVNPTGGYEGDFEEIDELAREVGNRLFRVGYDLPEGGIILMDENGRFFYHHWSGAYFMGNDFHEALGNWLAGDLQELG
ncbi:SUKH-3 domain-containing protein [Streptomyces sp. NPDC026294]|uniref:SUKH-3 domain-containing protein n=1 Tax=Streptomyces sp. NPDC026294 TaxID=3155362 RepID=UPI0033C546A4